MLKQSSCALLRKKLVSLTVRFSSSCDSSCFALLADQQAVVAVERIQLALFQPALQTVLQEVRAAVVEVHAALLVDERLQQFQFRVGEWQASGCAHDVFMIECATGSATYRAAAPRASGLRWTGRLGLASIASCSAAAAEFQHLADVEQNDQPALVLAQAGHAIQSAFLHHGGRRFDVASGIFRTSDAESTIMPASRP